MLRWVVLLGLVACVEPAPELPWRLELAVPERDGTIFDLYVVDGTRMTRPSAPARSWKRGDAPFELRLSNGAHAIRATAVDPSCRVYASGCVELTVPRDSTTEGPIVLRLGARGRALRTSPSAATATTPTSVRAPTAPRPAPRRVSTATESSTKARCARDVFPSCSTGSATSAAPPRSAGRRRARRASRADATS